MSGVNNTTTQVVTVGEVSTTLPIVFEDSSFTSGDSPATIDINAQLGQNATSLVITCDGAGDFTYQLSEDGVVFGDATTLKEDETDTYDDYSIHSIKITYVSANSAYRGRAG